MTIRIGMRDNELKVIIDEREFDNSGNLISELNIWLNNGYKLTSVIDGTYNLEEDKEQLCFIEYADVMKKHYYIEVTTHATAHLFRMYYGGCLTNVLTSDDEEIDEMELDSKHIMIVDLRGKSEKEIEQFRSLEKRTNLYVKDAILEDSSNQ